MERGRSLSVMSMLSAGNNGHKFPRSEARQDKTPSKFDLVFWSVMLNEAKTSMPRPKHRDQGRGRGQSYEAETEAEARASRPRPRPISGG